MNKWVLLLGCLLACASQAQTREIWEWTDANGVRHFSDSPGPGAKRVVIAAPPPATARPAPTAAAAARPAPAPREATDVQYSSLEIWTPENGASFFTPDAMVEIRIRSEPQLAPNDRLLTYLDGKLLPDENQTNLQVSNLERGAHSVTSVILDLRGNEKIRSAPVVFHMKQPSTNNNPRSQGPAVRPPQPVPLPRPTPRG